MGLWKKRIDATGQPVEFAIEWGLEVPWASCVLEKPMILLTDHGGLTGDDLTTVLAHCRIQGRPLLVVSPGVDSSAREPSIASRWTAVRATDLDGQPLADLLEDLAIASGGRTLLRQLGFGLHFPDSLDPQAEHGIVIPRCGWEDVRSDDLGTADEAVVGGKGVLFRWKNRSSPQSRAIQGRREQIAAGTASPGREARLDRLGRVPGSGEMPSGLSAYRIPEGTLEIPFPLVSACFHTDLAPPCCRLEGPRILITGEPLTQVEWLLACLASTARERVPLFILAPRVSEEVLAVCVVNKLRGVIGCGIATARCERLSPVDESVFASIAQDTKARIVFPSATDASAGLGGLGRAKRVQATLEGKPRASTQTHRP